MSIQIYNDIGQQFSSQYGTSVGQMFGKPCLKTKNKAFAAFFKEAMIFKLGQQKATLMKMKYPGAENWDPSGKKRPMKDWLQVPSEFSNDWPILAKQAFDFVESKE